MTSLYLGVCVYVPDTHMDGGDQCPSPTHTLPPSSPPSTPATMDNAFQSLTLNGNAHAQSPHHYDQPAASTTITADTSDAVNNSQSATVAVKADKKTSKFSALTRIFKPWKWKRRKKPSEKIVKKAVGESCS